MERLSWCKVEGKDVERELKDGMCFKSVCKSMCCVNDEKWAKL